MTTAFRSLLSAALSLGILVPPSFGAGSQNSWETQIALDKPLAHWKFEEPAGSAVALCATTAELDGTYSASGLALDEPGIVGKSVTFDGSGAGRIQVLNHPLLNPAQISLEALAIWSGPVASEPDLQQRILEKSTESSGKNPLYALMIRSIESKVGFEVNTTSGFKALLSSSPVTPGTPLHIVATYDGSQLALYINGALEGVAPWSGALHSGTTRNLGIGNQIERSRPFFGTIDEIALYDYALSPVQIQNHAFAAFPPQVDPSWEEGSMGRGCSAGGSERTSGLALPSLLLLLVLSKSRRPSKGSTGPH